MDWKENSEATRDLVTRRLLLRDFAETDLPALEAYQADPRYTEFWPDSASAGRARELLTVFQQWAVECPRLNYQFAIVLLNGSRELIGSCGLRRQGMGDGTAEFGIEIAPLSWGRGYAKEAANAMLRFGFGELGLHEVRGISVTENIRVASLVSRLGFTAVGNRAGPSWMAARGWSQTEWQLTRARWEAMER
jgi:RimJ/RimL family protein N-acetyltransferase